MKSETAIVEELKKRLKDSNRNLSRQRENTRKCRAFYAGDYMQYTDRMQLTTTSGQKKRVTVQINKIKPYVNAVKGFLAQNRRKPNYIARMQDNPAQQFYSKYANELSEYLRGNMNAEQVETQQDGDMLMAGLGVIETAMTYGEGYASRSVNGEIAMSCIDLDMFWYDAQARETNLVDARYMGVTKQYHLKDALALFSGSEEEDFDEILEQSASDYEGSNQIGTYDRIKYDWTDRKEGMVNVHFYHWFDIESYYRADNPVAGLQNPQSKMAATMQLQAIAGQTDDDYFDPAAETLAFNEETKDLLVESFGEFIEPIEFNKKVFYSAICSGDKCFTAFKSEHQDGFSLKVKTGDYDAKNKIWTGMVNSMMEPQKYYNKALTELMFIIAANSKGGVIVEDDAVEDIEEFSDQYAKTDAVCVVRSGAISGGKIKDKRQPFQPTGYENIIQIADAAVADVSGIDRTFLGSSENKLESAQLQRQRIRQIVSTLACFVDSISLFSKEHARLMLDLMRVFAQNNRGELFRIVGENGTAQFIQISEDKLSADYDVIIEESPVTPEERQEMADRLTQIGDKLLAGQDIQTAKAFYALSAKYMALDQEDVQSITDLLVPQQGQVDPAYVKQLEQLVQQLQSQMNKAQVDNLNADTKKLLAAANKDLADAAKTTKEADLTVAQTADTRANVHKKAAETVKVLGEADQKHIENKLIKTRKVKDFTHPLTTPPQPLKPQKGA